MVESSLSVTWDRATTAKRFVIWRNTADRVGHYKPLNEPRRFSQDEKAAIAILVATIFSAPAMFRARSRRTRRRQQRATPRSVHLSTDCPAHLRAATANHRDPQRRRPERIDFPRQHESRARHHEHRRTGRTTPPRWNKPRPRSATSPRRVLSPVLKPTRRSTKFSRPTSAPNIRRCSKTWAAAVRVDVVAAAAMKVAAPGAPGDPGPGY